MGRKAPIATVKYLGAVGARFAEVSTPVATVPVAVRIRTVHPLHYSFALNLQKSVSVNFTVCHLLFSLFLKSMFYE
jgi:hypothetical protein